MNRYQESLSLHAKVKEENHLLLVKQEVEKENHSLLAWNQRGGVHIPSFAEIRGRKSQGHTSGSAPIVAHGDHKQTVVFDQSSGSQLQHHYPYKEKQQQWTDWQIKR